MSVLNGCESKFRTPVPEDRVCPVCGKAVEVFILNGRIAEDAVCDCGYVFKAQDLDSPKVEHKE